MNRAEVISTRRSNPLREPRWPPLVAMLAVTGLYVALPNYLLGRWQSWSLAVILVVLLVPIVITHHRGKHAVNQTLGYALNTVVTAATVISLGLLIYQVATDNATAGRLLISAAAIWTSNVLVFASWYWRLDGGGPHERALTPGHTDGAFLFPQMTMHPDAKTAAGEDEWQPNFVDYLFLAFNTSTAFSPTDVPVLSRWAKALMMVQSLISLLVVAVLAGRAINIVGQAKNK